MRTFWQWLGFHIHQWTRWEKDSEIVSTLHKGVIGYRQERHCESCGKVQSNRIW